MPRYFTLSEAERALPEVESALRDALFHKAEYEKAHQAIESHAQRMRTSGGMRFDPGAHLARRALRDASAAGLKDAIERVERAGAFLKDLDIGLIDFITLYHGREVCLCWKLGEEGIHFWHGLEEGFRGRKPIDEEFLKAHRGDMTN